VHSRSRYRGLVNADTPELADRRRLLEEQAALRRLAILVAGEPDPDRLFDLVSEQAARVLCVESTAVARYEQDDTATVVGRWSAPGLGGIPVGTVVRLDGDGTLVRVRRTRVPARIDDYEGIEGEPAQRAREAGFRSMAAAPITVSGGLWGALVVGTGQDEPLPEDTEQRLGAFAELVAVAVSSADAWQRLLESRARIVQASDAERRRLERNLHDGAQQLLVSALLQLRVLDRRLQSGEDVRDLVANAIDHLHRAHDELRELAKGLHPRSLVEGGLRPALRALAEDAPLLVELAAVPDARLPEPAEVAAYFVVAEALTNVVKYAQATRAVVRVVHDEAWLSVEVGDDGVGGADAAVGSGLRGLADRVEALRGRLEVESPAGGGTTVRARIALARGDSL
jgi:signal transduction histidine kinase